MPSLSDKQKNIFFLLLCLIIVAFFQRRSMLLPPVSTHAWAMADWYALALGFLDNGMDFFHPMVSQLNLQFPPETPLSNPQGYTSADFPIIPFLAAVCMKTMGTESPIIYRSITLFVSLTGLTFLFFAARNFTKSFGKSVAITAFVLFQPAYIFYMNGFLPTQNALSLFFIGTYFLVKYNQSKQVLQLLLATLFLTLAALIRLPFAIPIIALSMTFGLGIARGKRLNFKHLIIPILGLIPIGIYFIYNTHLANIYGSVFLNHPLPPRNLNDVFFYLILGPIINFRSVLPLPHLFICILVFVLSYRKFFKSGKYKQNLPELTYIGLTLLGSLAYALLMGRQLYSHDYYYNDFLFPPLVITMTFLLGQQLHRQKQVQNVFIILFLAASINIAYETHSNKYYSYFGDKPGIRSSLTYGNSKNLLETAQVPRDAKILVLGTFEPSVPANFMRRKCFIVRIPTAETIKRAFTWNFDYIVCPLDIKQNLMDKYPPWEKTVARIASDQHLGLYKLK